MGFDEMKNIYEFKGKIINLTPFHIGSARSFSPIDPDNPVIRDSRDIPYIPGSSLRGIIRATVEALMRADAKRYNKKPEEMACRGIDTGDWCVKPEDRKNSETEKDWEKKVEDETCKACKLFGSGVIASRVKVFDSYIRDPKEGSYTFIKDGVAIRRDTRTAADKAKYDYEVVMPYNEFDFRMIVQDPEENSNGGYSDMRYIVSALELLNKGYVQIGGKKGSGLGVIEIQYEIRKLTLDDILTGKDGTIKDKESFL